MKKMHMFELILGECKQDPDPGFKNSHLQDPNPAENGPVPRIKPWTVWYRTVLYTYLCRTTPGW